MSTSLSAAQQAQAVIEAYIRTNGNGFFSGWYVGIARDPRNRLFQDHNVTQHGGLWIYQNCGLSSAARRVEKHFLGKGCKGGGSGGNYTTHFVYAYKITASTIE